MRAMTLDAPRTALKLETRPNPKPEHGEILVRVSACAVCRTDLHVVDGDLPQSKMPIVPGHEIVGRVEACGPGVSMFAVGARVGIPWLGGTCGACGFCDMGHENLCDRPTFTGYTRDGGFASHVVANANYAFALPDGLGSDVEAAPLLCAGLIGWRCLTKVPEGRALGLYGFGAAGHIIAQVARFQNRQVYAFTRPGDHAAQSLARSLGCVWAGGSDEAAPETLDAAIIFAPVGTLVPVALRAVRKGGRVVCGGIQMTDIPAFPYSLLWGERELISVANLTRVDARNFLAVAMQTRLAMHTTSYPLEQANEALANLRDGSIVGAAVLVP
ncbi:MAG: zinc-dependent alcohol dehydrogenase family protein [Alphaproteobacteria bacterium]|nr:zinc-dependent alcohol dehydrogenase family protein [Alphaproteobacteria bacterium]